ncbi:MAG: hypothetical protein HC906_08555 [Bacteroidales bacterium]|nr:hypothetical protein [Bacteroidales bacterium]
MIVEDNLDQLIEDYVVFAKNAPDFVAKRKIAVLTSTPDHVVVLSLFKLLNTLPIHVEIFYTYCSALRWLGIFEDEFRLKYLFKEFSGNIF